MFVQLIRRHDETRTRLLNFVAERGIQPDQVNLAPGPGGTGYFHSHSSRSASYIRKYRRFSGKSSSGRGGNGSPSILISTVRGSISMRGLVSL